MGGLLGHYLIAINAECEEGDGSLCGRWEGTGRDTELGGMRCDVWQAGGFNYLVLLWSFLLVFTW